MGEDTVNNTLGRGVDMVYCHVGGADESSELFCFYYMFSELGGLDFHLAERCIPDMS